LGLKKLNHSIGWPSATADFCSSYDVASLRFAGELKREPLAYKCSNLQLVIFDPMVRGRFGSAQLDWSKNRFDISFLYAVGERFEPRIISDQVG